MTAEEKLETLYAALSEMDVTEKLPSITVKIKRTGNRPGPFIDFSTGISRATAANRVSLLLNNIACLRDYLKVWCRENGKPFTGDKLIKSNKDVGIIHDLWNLDKHAYPDRSRTGLFPRFSIPPQTMVAIKEGGGVSISPTEGASAQTEGDARLCIFAFVVDRNRNPLGVLEEISLRAVTAWEAEFVKAGFSLVQSPQQ